MFKKSGFKSKRLLLLTGCWLLAAVLSGCVVRTYKVTKDRIDQELATGNRGYLQGQISAGEETKGRKATRTIQAVEIELHSPIKFEKTPKTKEKAEGAAAGKLSSAKKEPVSTGGNRGYITGSRISRDTGPETSGVSLSMKKYTVKKGDTLQKIAREFYGTTRKWAKIYDANRDILKGPDKIYPGQVINVPLEEPLDETGQNLK